MNLLKEIDENHTKAISQVCYMVRVSAFSYLTLRWPRGEGGCHFSNRFFQFFSGMGRSFLQTKFLAVGSSLGHLSMKRFLDWTHRLGPKTRQREGARGWQPPPLHLTEQKLACFSNHEDDIRS